MYSKTILVREDALQSQCIKTIEKFFPSILYHHSPNEGLRTLRTGARNKRLGVSRGFPDLILFIKQQEKPIFVEFKSLKGRQTKEQKKWQTDLERLGFKYFIIRSEFDFFTLLKSFSHDPQHTRS